ncbi:MAG TPA: hypothetical protein VIB00_00390 [Pyrinomonadaceae bacterium]
MRRSPITFILIAWFSVASVMGQEAKSKASPFDSFGYISSDDASARLDNFAVGLEQQPAAMGYVVSYGPRGKGAGTGTYLGQVLKNYLVSTRELAADRIQTIYGGRYKNPEDIFTELWIVPAGSPAPEPMTFKSKLKTVKGKFADASSWDGYNECACGPVFGNVLRAAFADVLMEQRNDLAYIVASSFPDSSPGHWRRTAKNVAAELREEGIEGERIKIIYGGTNKLSEDDLVDEVKFQYWILPADAPPPVREAKPERTPKKAALIGQYHQWTLKFPRSERAVFDGVADVLRSDPQLSLFLIIRPEIPRVDEYRQPDEPPDIDPVKLVERWKSELLKLGIKESRILVVNAGAQDYGPVIDVWVIPPGASLPDPHAEDEGNPVEP